MKKITKITCLVLVFVLVSLQLPFESFARNENVPTYQAEQTEVKSQDKIWTYDIVLGKNDEPLVWVTDFNYRFYQQLNSDVFTFPGVIDGMRVQSVDVRSFHQKIYQNARKIVFEENIERIAGNFSYFKNAEPVFPSTLLMIDDDSFNRAKLTSLHFPEGLCSIGKNAFGGCTFTEQTDIVFPESLEYLGDGAFDNTNITSADMGSKAVFCAARFSQTSGVYYDTPPTYPCMPFSNCSRFSRLTIAKNNPNFTEIGGIIYTADKQELVFVNEDQGDLVMDKSVEYICQGALDNRSFERLVFSPSILNFHKLKFNNTQIGELRFAAGCDCENISNSQFESCKIKALTIPKSVKIIGQRAFLNCGIEELTFEEGSRLNEVRTWAFCGNCMQTLDLTPCRFLITAFSLKNCEFGGNPNLEIVDMTGVPMEEISVGMFGSCPRLKEFRISEFTRIIQRTAFKDDSALEIIDLSKIAQYEADSFENCDKLDLSAYRFTTGTTENGFSYNEFDDHISLTGYTGEATELLIPDSINAKPVTDIIWRRQKALEFREITIAQWPYALSLIGSEAFIYSNTNAISDFPDTLRYIGRYAFAGNDFHDIKLNEGLVCVLPYAFQYCPFESLVIPDSVVYYDGGFYRNETSVTFGKNVGNIDEILDISNEAYRPQNIYISPENPYFCFENGVLYNGDKTVIIKYYSYYNASEQEDNYQIPASVKRIEWRAFHGCEHLKDLVIPAGVEYIGKEAFTFSSVTSVYFADGFQTETLHSTFSCCEKLQTATFGDVVVKNLIATFSISGVQNVDIPESVENLTDTYDSTNLSSVTELKLPQGLKVLGSYAFGFSKLAIRELRIPEGVTAIGTGAFRSCKQLETIDFCNVKFLGREAFSGCISLGSVDLTGIRYIADKNKGATFLYCDNLKIVTYLRTDEADAVEDSANRNNDLIETVVIGNGIDTIKTKAFADCANLETAVIADSVETIADDAFENCEKLTIVCTEQSQAQAYAERKQIPYKTFKILPIPDQEYTGKEIKPQLRITVGEEVLKAGEDYAVSYTNNIQPGTARATAVGLGNYSIYAATVKFNIVHTHAYTAKTTPATCTAKGFTTYTCAKCGDNFVSDYVNAKGHSPGEAHKENVVAPTCTKAGRYDSVVSCSLCGAELSRKTVAVSKSSHSYSNTKMVKPTAAQAGYTEQRCSGCGITRRVITPPTGKVKQLRCNARSANAQTMIWSAIKGTQGYQIQVSDKEGKEWDRLYNAKKNTSFTFKRLAGGSAYKFRVRIFAKGVDGKLYYGAWSQAVTSPTLPTGTVITKLTGGGKSFTGQWKKNKTVTGYQIQYSTNKEFVGAKTVSVKSGKTLKTTVNKLHAKKLYYVRIRTYKTTEKVNYFSAWSKIYRVKTK